jgi:hypothetical protein
MLSSAAEARGLSWKTIGRCNLRHHGLSCHKIGVAFTHLSASQGASSR